MHKTSITTTINFGLVREVVAENCPFPYHFFKEGVFFWKVAVVVFYRGFYLKNI
jgi:hypothetical protein